MQKLCTAVGNTVSLHDQTHERSNGVRNITPIMISVLLGKSTIHEKKDTIKNFASQCLWKELHIKELCINVRTQDKHMFCTYT